MTRRKYLFAAAVVVAVGGVAAGVAYAAIPGGNGAIQGCYTKIGGLLRVVDSATQCTKLEVPLSWNQNGQPGVPGQNGQDGQDGQDGAPGVSPTVTQLPAGDPNCPAGGAQITDANGSTAYVCSGQDGQNGQNGADGQSFSGTFTSPNGQYSISVTDAGISLTQAGGSRIVIANNAVEVRGTTSVSVLAGTALSLKGTTDATLEGGVTATIKTNALIDVDAPIVRIGGSSCRPAARFGDTVAGTAAGGVVSGTVISGSTSVCLGG